MKRIWLVIACCILGLDACAPSENAVNTAIAQTQAANPTATFTAVPPSKTPRPTATRRPTPTRTKTPTNTPVPDPITLTGSGDSIIDFEKWEGAAILKIKYTGGGNFAVRNYPANSNDYYDLLVNTIGAYEGTVPLDFYENQQTTRFEIMSAGPWEFQILPFESIRLERIPGTIQGVGDDVMLIGGGTPDLLKVDASQATSNFIVLGLSDTSKDLLVNEIAPYTGTVILDASTIILITTAEGPWSFEITTR